MKLLDMVKSIEVRFTEAWHQDFMQQAYTSLVLVNHEKEFDVDSMSELDMEIIEEGQTRDIEKEEIEEAMKYIETNYPAVLSLAITEASFALSRKNYKLRISPILVDMSTDIYRDDELLEVRKRVIGEKLDSLKDVDFAFDFQCWGAQYDYNEVDITDSLYVAVQVYTVEESDVEIIKAALEECGCGIEVF